MKQPEIIEIEVTTEPIEQEVKVPEVIKSTMEEKGVTEPEVIVSTGKGMGATSGEMVPAESIGQGVGAPEVIDSTKEGMGVTPSTKVEIEVTGSIGQGVGAPEVTDSTKEEMGVTPSTREESGVTGSIGQGVGAPEVTDSTKEGVDVTPSTREETGVTESIPQGVEVPEITEPSTGGIEMVVGDSEVIVPTGEGMGAIEVIKPDSQTTEVIFKEPEMIPSTDARVGPIQESKPETEGSARISREMEVIELNDMDSTGERMEEIPSTKDQVGVTVPVMQEMEVIDSRGEGMEGTELMEIIGLAESAVMGMGTMEKIDSTKGVEKVIQSTEEIMVTAEETDDVAESTEEETRVIQWPEIEVEKKSASTQDAGSSVTTGTVPGLLYSYVDEDTAERKEMPSPRDGRSGVTTGAVKSLRVSGEGGGMLSGEGSANTAGTVRGLLISYVGQDAGASDPWWQSQKASVSQTMLPGITEEPDETTYVSDIDEFETAKQAVSSQKHDIACQSSFAERSCQCCECKDIAISTSEEHYEPITQAEMTIQKLPVKNAEVGDAEPESESTGVYVSAVEPQSTKATNLTDAQVTSDDVSTMNEEAPKNAGSKEDLGRHSASSSEERSTLQPQQISEISTSGDIQKLEKFEEIELKTDSFKTVRKSSSEVPDSVSKLSNRSNPPLANGSDSKRPKRKRSSKLEYSRCDCPGVCQCVVCSPEIIARRRAATGSADPPNGSSNKLCCCVSPPYPRTQAVYMQTQYYRNSPQHIPGCPCSPPSTEAFLRSTNLAATQGALPKDRKRISIDDVFFLAENCPDEPRKNIIPNKSPHTRSCECIDCLCLPHIQRIAQTREFPIIKDEKQIYQVSTPKCECTNATNARRYLSERSRIPIATNSTLGPPRVKTPCAAPPCVCDVCDCSPCGDQAKSTGAPIASEANPTEPVGEMTRSAEGQVLKMTAGQFLGMNPSDLAKLCHCEQCKCELCFDKPAKLKETIIPVKANQIIGMTPSDLAKLCHCEQCTCEVCFDKQSEGTRVIPSSPRKMEAPAIRPHAEVPAKTSQFLGMNPSDLAKLCHCQQCKCELCFDKPAKLKETIIPVIANQIIGMTPSDFAKLCHCEQCTCAVCFDKLGEDSGAVVAAAEPPPDDDCDCTVCVECPRAPKKAEPEPVEPEPEPQPEAQAVPELQPVESVDKKPSLVQPPPEILPPGPADCDCDECQCGPCADPKKQKSGVPEEPSKQEEEPPEIKDVLEEPSEEEQPVAQAEPPLVVSEPASKYELAPCDCMVCTCLPCPDSAKTGKEVEAAPPQAAAASFERVSSVDTGGEHPGGCTCDICVCPGKSKLYGQLRRDKTVKAQPTPKNTPETTPQPTPPGPRPQNHPPHAQDHSPGPPPKPLPPPKAQGHPERPKTSEKGEKRGAARKVSIRIIARDRLPVFRRNRKRGPKRAL
ncbi:hypothetical protein JTB14_032752 [Gonioctena quinquepunctata]|nr:hypothetical protein JTB14_032752 [Gonioctena quinquepunctata]